jgi:dihydropyrimidinase
MVDDETLFRVMQVAAETGALVMVHAEHGDSIDVLVKQALAEGNTEPHWHALTRPPETEGEATHRAAHLARVAGCNLYVVHVSCAPAIEAVALARQRGWSVWGETCTQYFFIDYSYLERPNFEGAKYVYTPPPRPKEHQEHLWAAVKSDVLSVVSTDHCSFRWDGQKTLGRDDFSKIPNGGPGIEDRLMMMHQFGVRGGRFTLGSDADIVVFDPEKRVTLSAKRHHSRCDYNLYEGTEVQGAPEVVLLRGRVLVEDGELVAPPGFGQFIRRARFGEELLPAYAART